MLSKCQTLLFPHFEGAPPKCIKNHAEINQLPELQKCSLRCKTAEYEFF